MSTQIFTLKNCKNLSSEITVDMEDILYVEKLRGGNAKIHFQGHDAVTVLEPYEVVVAWRYPAEPSILAFDGTERRVAERRTESIENLGIDEDALDDSDFPTSHHNRHPKRKNK